MPAAEVIETNNSYQIALELPGVDRESIDVKATERSLVISAERKAPESANETEAQALVREFRYGNWSRSFRFPRGINHNSFLMMLTPALVPAPIRSMRSSSMRLRLRVNSMRRGVPSRKKIVLVSLRLSITHSP